MIITTCESNIRKINYCHFFFVDIFLRFLIFVIFFYNFLKFQLLNLTCAYFLKSHIINFFIFMFYDNNY